MESLINNSSLIWSMNTTLQILQLQTFQPRLLLNEIFADPSTTRIIALASWRTNGTLCRLSILGLAPLDTQIKPLLRLLQKDTKNKIAKPRLTLMEYVSLLEQKQYGSLMLSLNNSIILSNKDKRFLVFLIKSTLKKNEKFIAKNNSESTSPIQNGTSHNRIIRLMLICLMRNGHELTSGTRISINNVLK